MFTPERQSSLHVFYGEQLDRQGAAFSGRSARYSEWDKKFQLNMQVVLNRFDASIEKLSNLSNVSQPVRSENIHNFSRQAMGSFRRLAFRPARPNFQFQAA